MKAMIKEQLVSVNAAYFKYARWIASQAAAPSVGGRSLFFTPHADDEVLGCGGTIAVHQRLKRHILIVYLSSGASLHRSKRISAGDLVALRQAETFEAVSALGVPKENVVFFDLEDGNLPHPEEPTGVDAVERLAEIMNWQRPDEIYAPFRFDPNSDHMAGYAIFDAAKKKARPTGRQREYPVWFWERSRFWRMEAAGWRRGIKSDIAAVLPLKRQAIDAYRSQITDLKSELYGPEWEKWSPQFVQNFLYPYEFFWETEGSA